jgi:F-type H+-transporting ATPase subunit epsilon
MTIQILTPDKTIFSGEGKLVQLPGLDGSFEIMKNHAPIIAALKAGKVKIKDAADSVTFYDISGGVVEVMENQVLVLAG